MESLLGQQSALRVLAFATGFVAIAAWEALAPRRPRQLSRAWRWANHLGVLAIGSVLTRVLLPAGAIGAALLARERGWGLLNQVDLPAPIEWAIALLALDLVIWAQHLLFHRLPPLWRLHRMHHADLDFDVSTGLRFHPLEILVSMLVKMAVVTVLGAAAAAVLAFEVILNLSSMFTHANGSLPAAFERGLRLLIVTPEMHRVHHSWQPDETNSNYGFNLACWDRLFGTYRAQPRAGHLAMTIGLHEFRDPRDGRLDRLLVQPFVRALPPRGGG